MENMIPPYDGLSSSLDIVNTSYFNLSSSWISPVPTELWTGFAGAPFNFGDLYSATTNWSYSASSSLPFAVHSCEDGDTTNCTSFCTNATLLFGNNTMNDALNKHKPVEMNVFVVKNILACMYYPLISQWLVSDQIGQEAKAKLKSVADEYGIMANASVDIINDIVDTQRHCYLAYCEVVDDGEKPCLGFNNNEKGLNGTTYAALRGEGLLDIFPDWSTTSPNSTMSINTDIGGIGVSIGYIMQFSIILTAWLYLRTLRLLKYHTKSQDHKHAWRIFGKGLIASLPKSVQHRLLPFYCMLDETQKQVMSLLRDFQKAQCFFLIPLNVAILFGIFGKTSMFSITSLGQLDRNLLYLQCVTQGSIIFATSCLFFLFTGVRRSEEVELEGGKDSNVSKIEKEAIKKTARNRRLRLWLLTVVTVALSSAAWSQAFRNSKPEMKINPERGNSKTAWIGYCGIVSPATYNGERWDGRWEPNKLWARMPVIVFSWLILSVLIVDVFWNHPLFKRLLRREARVPHGPSNEDILSKTRLGLVVLAELIFLICLVCYVVDYVNYMEPGLPVIDKTFTLGQLLAMFVWSGTIYDSSVKLPKAAIHGWRKGRKNIAPLTENGEATILTELTKSVSNHAQYDQLSSEGDGIARYN